MREIGKGFRPESPVYDAASGAVREDAASTPESWHDRLRRLTLAHDYAGALALLRSRAPEPEDGRYVELGRACEANGLAGFGDDGEMWFQPPADLLIEAGKRQAIAESRE